MLIMVLYLLVMTLYLLVLLVGILDMTDPEDDLDWADLKVREWETRQDRDDPEDF